MKETLNLFAKILMSEESKTINYQGSTTMKKSTMAVAALLTVLSSVPVMSVAYADESTTPNVAATGDTPTPTCAPATEPNDKTNEDGSE